MKLNFLTTTNKCNGYGMSREYFKKYLPLYGIELFGPKDKNPYSLILHIPPAVEGCFGKKILYTMVEGDEVPNSWKPFLDTVDTIIVPSNFVSETFKRSGYKTAVYPLGFDEDLFKPVVRDNKVFTFLHYEAFQNRKGWLDVVDAWLLSGLAEKEYECQLILKTVLEPQKVCEKIENMFIPTNVHIICGELPHRSIYDILCQADCFVFPSHGEGFSLPPIEAMATGCPVIITIGHSHLDFYNENFMYGVSADIKIPARYDSWEDQGNFVRCKVDDLASKLRYVYEHQKEAKDKGSRSVEYVSKYKYSKTMGDLAGYLWQIVGQ